MSCTQLTEVERYQISTLKKEGYGPSGIAARLGRDKSTVGRELRRNAGQRGYFPKQAQEKAEARR